MGAELLEFSLFVCLTSSWNPSTLIGWSGQYSSLTGLLSDIFFELFGLIIMGWAGLGCESKYPLGIKNFMILLIG